MAEEAKEAEEAEEAEKAKRAKEAERLKGRKEKGIQTAALRRCARIFFWRIQSLRILKGLKRSKRLSQNNC